MDTQTFPKAHGDYEAVKKESLLPAGSTLEIAPGVHVPHPQAAPNERLAPDPRLGDTKAVSVLLDGRQAPLLDHLRPTRSLKAVVDPAVEPEPKPAEPRE